MPKSGSWLEKHEILTHGMADIEWMLPKTSTPQISSESSELAEVAHFSLVRASAPLCWRTVQKALPHKATGTPAGSAPTSPPSH